MNYMFSTRSERIVVIENLRKPGIYFPNDWDTRRSRQRRQQALGTMLQVPLLDQRHILCTHHLSGSLVKWMRSPPESDCRSSVRGVEILVVEEWLNLIGQLKLVLVVADAENLILVANSDVFWCNRAGRYRIDDRVEIKGG